MPSQNFTRAVLFVVFFGIGAAVLGGTVLCDDLLEYFHNRALFGRIDDSIGKLESLNADYDALLSQLEQDPNYAKRIAPVTLGAEPCEPNTAFPRATADKLAAAKKALTEAPNEPSVEDATPPWLTRCCRSPQRQILFACGTCLIVISFVFFGPTKPKKPTMKMTSRTDNHEKPQDAN
jgi:hypothetical protein